MIPTLFVKALGNNGLTRFRMNQSFIPGGQGVADPLVVVREQNQNQNANVTCAAPKWYSIGIAITVTI